MRIQKSFALFVAIATMQTVALHGQDLFRVKFRGTCKPGDQGQASIKVTDHDLIAACLESNVAPGDIDRDFALVYNASADSIQVVNSADGSVLCDVFQFQGGTAAAGNNELNRLTFVFSPDQADSIGTAVITEKAAPHQNSNRSRANIRGKLQFTSLKPLHSISRLSGAEAKSGSDANQTGDMNVTNPGSGNPGTDRKSLSSGGTNDTTVISSADITTAVADTGNTAGNAGSFVQSSALATATTGGQVCTGTFAASRPFVPGANNGSAKAGGSKKKSKANNTEITTTDNTVTDQTAADMTSTNAPPPLPGQ